MKIKKIEVGYLKENCYTLEINGKCIVIDPGSEYNKIKKEIAQNEVLGILITHRHFDHIGALEELLEEYKVEVFDYKKLEEKEYKVGPFKFEVIFNPGHTKDSVSFYFKEDNIMFVGDFIFKNNIGRCDLAGGDLNTMYKSLEKIKKYHDCIIYPGHGNSTSLNIEKEYNPYFKIETI